MCCRGFDLTCSLRFDSIQDMMKDTLLLNREKQVWLQHTCTENGSVTVKTSYLGRLDLSSLLAFAHSRGIRIQETFMRRQGKEGF
jgi:hypothetical protein